MMFQASFVWACLVSFAYGRRVQQALAQHDDWNLDTGSFARLLLALQRSHSSVRPSRRNLDTVLSMRGGADIDLKVAVDSNELVSSVLMEVSREVSSLREVLSGGEPVSDFGSKVDRIISNALDKFDSNTPSGDRSTQKLFAIKRGELEASIQNNLSPVFLQQVCMLKGMALEVFLKDLAGDNDGAAAMISAEKAFVRGAAASVPTSQKWSFRTDHDSLVRSMQAIVNERSKANDAKVKSGQQLQTAMTYLQSQQKQMRELQAAYLGGQENKWSVGAAYRPADTDINLSSKYENGRCNVQVSMVPDEGANLLGPHGFTRGMGPANLGLTFNIHM